MTVKFSQINSLDETQFFANSDFIFYFNFKEEDGVTPFDLTGATVTLVMCPYGDTGNNVLQKDATITDDSNGECNVALVPADTEDFSGRYVMQIVIVISGTTYRPAQGLV